LLEDVWLGDVIVSRAVPVSRAYRFRRKTSAPFDFWICGVRGTLSSDLFLLKRMRMGRSLFVGLARLVASSKGGGSDDIANRSNTRTSGSRSLIPQWSDARYGITYSRLGYPSWIRGRDVVSAVIEPVSLEPFS